MANEVGRATPVQVGLSDVIEHLAIAFGGIYEKITERDREVTMLRERINAQDEAIGALSHRIESVIGVLRKSGDAVTISRLPS